MLSYFLTFRTLKELYNMVYIFFTWGVLQSIFKET